MLLPLWDLEHKIGVAEGAIWAGLFCPATKKEGKKRCLEWLLLLCSTFIVACEKSARGLPESMAHKIYIIH